MVGRHRANVSFGDGGWKRRHQAVFRWRRSVVANRFRKRTFTIVSPRPQDAAIATLASIPSFPQWDDFHRIQLDAVHLKNRSRDDKLLALDSALDRLDKIDASKAQLVKLRFFSGLTTAEAAQAMGISAATAERSWAFSRAWLQSAMRAERFSVLTRDSLKNYLIVVNWNHFLKMVRGSATSFSHKATTADRNQRRR